MSEEAKKEARNSQTDSEAEIPSTSGEITADDLEQITGGFKSASGTDTIKIRGSLSQNAQTGFNPGNFKIQSHDDESPKET